MQRHLLPVLILALAVALPARASHHKTHSVAKAAAPVAAVPAPAPAATLAGSKGSRLAAQTPMAVPPGAKAKNAKTNSAKVAARHVSPAALPVTVQPTLMARLARLTAYWTKEDYWTSHHMSSTGVKLHEGVCAVDPKLIPYGSVVQIPGRGPFVAVDTGSAVVSRQAAIGASHTASQRDALVIDLFFENEHDAQQFAAHSPTYVAVSWTKPLTAVDAPLNPRALPAVAAPVAPPAPVYVLASAPTMEFGRMPLNFRAPQM
jgi:3D (Asp-Asp-Asp) domain-containing protein